VGTGRRVRAISAKTFLGNVSVTSLKAPDLWYVREQCFESATSLKSVHLPDVKSIAHSAFYNCGALKSVTPTVLGQLNTLGYRAFYYCNLSDTSLALPALSRYEWTFGEYGGTDIKIPRNRAFGNTKIQSVDFSGSTMTNVPPAMFANTSTATVTLPATIVSVDSEAFWQDGTFEPLQEVRFLGPPPALTNNWAGTPSSLNGRDYCMAVGFGYQYLDALKADPTFVARSDIPELESKPNYAEVRAKYKSGLKGVWHGKWLFIVGRKPLVFIIK